MKVAFGFSDEDEINSARAWVTKNILKTIRQQLNDEADRYFGLDHVMDDAVARWLYMDRYVGPRGPLQRIMSDHYGEDFLQEKDNADVIEIWWNELISWVQEFDEQRMEVSPQSTPLLTKLYWGAWLGIDEHRKDLGVEVPGIKTEWTILYAKEPGIKHSKFGSRHEYSTRKG